MNHFPDRLSVFHEWSRVLRHGHRAVFTDPVVITGPVTNDSRARHSDALIPIEGDERFEGLQRFFAAVHRLTSERRLSTIAYLAEKPPRSLFVPQPKV